MKTARVAALSERLGQPSDPALAGDEVPLVEERLKPLVPELAGEVLHGRLIGAGVAEENVVEGHRRLGPPDLPDAAFVHRRVVVSVLERLHPRRLRVHVPLHDTFHPMPEPDVRPAFRRGAAMIKLPGEQSSRGSVS